MYATETPDFKWACPSGVLPSPEVMRRGALAPRCAMLRVREQSTYSARPAAHERNRMTVLWIVVIVIVVLAILGYFGRGRFSR
jgi:hypothetical protein